MLKQAVAGYLKPAMATGRRHPPGAPVVAKTARENKDRGLPGPRSFDNWQTWLARLPYCAYGTCMFSTLVSDLDGTLLDSHHRIPPRTRSLLQQLNEQGTQLVLATGRHSMDVRQILEEAGLSAWQLSCNGARVQAPDGRLLLSRDIPPALAQPLAQRLLKLPQLSVHIYTDHYWYYSSLAGGQSSFAQDMTLPGAHLDRDKLPEEPVIKLFCCCQDTQLLASVQEQLAREYGSQLSITCSFPWCMEVMAAEVSKGWALRHLALHNDWSLDQCIAFGDGMNDAEMLQAVGTSVLMANADSRLHALLPHAHKTGSNIDQGVAAWLEQQPQLSPITASGERTAL